MQVLGDLTQILTWGPKQLKVLPDKLRGTWSFGIKEGSKILGGAMNPNDAMLKMDWLTIYTDCIKPALIPVLLSNKI